MSGILRKQILNNCSDDFKNELNSWIDDLELKLKDVAGKMEISSIDNIGDIYEAYDDLMGVVNDLY